MYEDFFKDFGVEWELDKIKASKSQMIRNCNAVRMAAQASERKWERLLKDIDKGYPLSELWFRALGEPCGFCRVNESCDECFVRTACHKMVSEFMKMPDASEGHKIDKEQFRDLVKAVIYFLARVNDETYYYKNRIVRSITGVEEYDNKEGEK